MKLSGNAIHYAVGQLFARALPNLETPSLLSREANRLTFKFSDGGKLQFALLEDTELQLFTHGDLASIMIATADEKEQLPVFKSAYNCIKNIEYQNDTDTLHIPYDLISPTFFFLSREEEYHEVMRDAHNRFLYSTSLACHYHCIHLPVVDEYAILLRKWILQYLRPQMAIQPRKSQIIPTHDIDLLYRFHSPWQSFRSIVGRDLLIDHSLSTMCKSIGEYSSYKKDLKNDPYISAIQELITKSEEVGLQSRFFFKSLQEHDSDNSYLISDPNVRYCIEAIKGAGMFVGLHGSYDSYDNVEKFGQEKQRLEKVMGSTIDSCRQHYLRFNLARNLQGSPLEICQRFATSRTPEYNLTTTLQVWKNCGIKHDYTLGYAEQPGFRCGTCHPYPIYDIENDFVTDIIEHPLIVMDGTLFDYLKLSEEDSYTLVSQLYRRSKAVEGDFVILWHNHVLGRQYSSYYQKIYLRLLQNK